MEIENHDFSKESIMNKDTQSLSTIVTESSIDLAISAWLHKHGKRSEEEHTRTSKAYDDTIRQFRAGLQRQGLDLDSDHSKRPMLRHKLGARKLMNWITHHGVIPGQLRDRLLLLYQHLDELGLSDELEEIHYYGTTYRLSVRQKLLREAQKRGSS
jgi:hypothetical protein